MKTNYSCMEVCGMPKHCGNRYCSNHPNYRPPVSKKKKKAEDAIPESVKRHRGGFFKSHVALDTSGSMAGPFGR